jgi:hypothetical protein
MNKKKKIIDQINLSEEELSSIKHNSEKKPNNSYQLIIKNDIAQSIILPKLFESPVPYGTVQIKAAECNNPATKRFGSCLMRIYVRCCNGRTKSSCPAEYQLFSSVENELRLSVYLINHHKCSIKSLQQLQSIPDFLTETEELSQPQVPSNILQDEQSLNENIQLIPSSPSEILVSVGQYQSRVTSNENDQLIASDNYQLFLILYDDLKSWIDSIIVKLSFIELKNTYFQDIQVNLYAILASLFYSFNSYNLFLKSIQYDIDQQYLKFEQFYSYSGELIETFSVIEKLDEIRKLRFKLDNSFKIQYYNCYVTYLDEFINSKLAIINSQMLDTKSLNASY